MNDFPAVLNVGRNDIKPPSYQPAPGDLHLQHRPLPGVHQRVRRCQGQRRSKPEVRTRNGPDIILYISYLLYRYSP